MVRPIMRDILFPGQKHAQAYERYMPRLSGMSTAIRKGLSSDGKRDNITI